MAAGDSAAVNEFVRLWLPRISGWIARKHPRHVIRDYAQEVLIHSARDNWARLLEWRGLYSDDAWNPHSLAAYLRTIPIRRAISLQRADRRQLPSTDGPVDIVDEHGPLVGAEGWSSELLSR